MRNVVVLAVFFSFAIASMVLSNIYVLLAAPVAANVVYIALLLTGWPKQRQPRNTSAPKNESSE